LPSRSRTLRVLLISVAIGVATGLGIDFLYFAAISNLDPVPEGLSDLLVPVWSAIFFLIAPGSAGIVAALIARSIARRQAADVIHTAEERRVIVSSPTKAAVLAATATLLVALGLTFGPLLLGMLLQ